MITAIILAAGESRRMGHPKMLLPWGDTTILGQVLTTYRSAGVQDLLVITGGYREGVEAIARQSARTLYNRDFASGEMLSSVQCGIRGLEPRAEAALIALGDQPLVREHSVRAVLVEYRKSNSTIIIPSYLRRRGHPWLVTRAHWDEILDLRVPSSLRDFLTIHNSDITYVDVDDPGVLQDLDTPEDYVRFQDQNRTE